MSQLFIFSLVDDGFSYSYGIVSQVPHTDTDTALTHFRSPSTVLYCRVYIEKVQNTTVIKHCIRYVSQLFIFSLDDRFSYSYGIVS